MAETVYLNDGSMEVILKDKGEFLEELLREKLGSDVARCFVAYIEDLKSDLEYQEQSATEQERSADGYYAMCNDALDSFREILHLLDAPRLSREALKNAARTGYNDLYNNL